MHYVISDIHGCYTQFMAMLDKINFYDTDVMIINGDIIDRGEDSMKILQYMIQHTNIYPIMGNHEAMAISTLDSIAYDTKINLTDFTLWECQGATSTIKGFKELAKDTQKKIVSYIHNFPMYKEMTLNQKKYVIVHAGFDYDVFDENKPLHEYDYDDQIWAETDYSKVYYKDKILITGHTPTALIDKKMAGKIIIKNNHIAIDCGCIYGGNLGCICLETGEEYYTK